MYILINAINFTGLLACLTSQGSIFRKWKLNFELQSMFFYNNQHRKTQNIPPHGKLDLFFSSVFTAVTATDSIVLACHV